MSEVDDAVDGNGSDVDEFLHERDAEYRDGVVHPDPDPDGEDIVCGGGAPMEEDPAPDVELDPPVGPVPPIVAVAVGPLAHPPLPPPAHPLPAPVGLANGAVPGDPWFQYDLGEIGFFVFDEAKESLNAHCRRHGRLCRLNRTVRASNYNNRSGQGRPVGQLGAWLVGADKYPDWTSHKAAARDERIVSWALRDRFRTWAESLPRFRESVSVLERPPRGGERSEPFALPG
jgi:hypothetical protein